MPRRFQNLLAALLVLLAFTANPARAGVWRDIGFGLGLAGFELQGDHNIISGGADFRISNDFVGVPLDAGYADLTLLGPISLSFATGGRGLSTLDFSLRTALDTTTPASPLGYSFNADVGSQETQVLGNFLLDANLSFNGFGFYDLDLIYSSRQTVENDGRVVNSSDNYDFDIGPIDIRGNVFVDMFGLVTAPLFSALGIESPFQQGTTLLTLLTPGGFEELAEFSLANLATAPDPFATLSDFLLGADGNAAAFASRTVLPNSLRVVPEPTVILLMLLGIPVLILGPGRRIRWAS